MSSLLAVYLQDHHAAGTAGTRLARRVASGLSSEHGGDDLRRVADEIAEDLSALEIIMRRLGAKPSKLKDEVARLGERLGKLKLNGRLRHRSPLSDVLELEALVVGITGKQALWVSLRSTALIPVEKLDDLLARAEAQKRTVESAREAAARRAFDPQPQA